MWNETITAGDARAPHKHAMNDRRSRIEIVGDILRTGPAGRTAMMLQCDLGYYQMQKYLSLLLDRGLLKVEDGETRQKTYRPTAAGEQLLRHIERVSHLLELPDRDSL